MIRALACLLVIHSMLAQSAALPHTHAGGVVHVPDAHDERPHFHLAGCSHGPAARHVRPLSFSHAPVADCYNVPPCDHDADAVYLNGGGTLCAAQHSGAAAMMLTAAVESACIVPDDASARDAGWSPGRERESVPIFLASTRLLV